MPRKRTGQARYRNGHWTARITIAGKRPTFRLAAHVASLPEHEEQARERAALLADIASAVDDAEMATTLVRKAAAATDAELPKLQRVVESAAAGRYVSQASRDGMTFKELATKWTSGELARDYPDHVRRKRSASDDVGRLEKHIYPLVEDVPLAAFKLDHAEQVMAALPPELAAGSRRQIAQLMHRVLSLAVFPMRLRESNPLPRGWLPKPGRRKAKAYLYPREEAKLLACSEVPLVRRLLFAFLAREGMRKGEALALTWADIDRQRGVVHLDDNKTDDPRAWALGSDVTEALRRWFELRGEPGEHAPVFADDDGAPLADIRADELRGALEAAGVSRPQLFERSKARAPLDVHGLRGTFVTLALAMGRSEAWVSDRTGHRSSQMINRYKRAARTAAELNLGWLAPMHEAIPELGRKGAEKAQRVRVRAKRQRSVWRKRQQSRLGARERTRTSTGVARRNLNRLRAAEGGQVVGRAGTSTGPGPSSPEPAPNQDGSAPNQDGAVAVAVDPVESALCEALSAATAARKWHVVAQLARELEARRKAHSASNVVPIEVAKGRTGNGGQS